MMRDRNSDTSRTVATLGRRLALAPPPRFQGHGVSFAPSTHKAARKSAVGVSSADRATHRQCFRSGRKLAYVVPTIQRQDERVTSRRGLAEHHLSIACALKAGDEARPSLPIVGVTSGPWPQVTLSSVTLATPPTLQAD